MLNYVERELREIERERDKTESENTVPPHIFILTFD